jgi:hypothetical protein
MLAWAWRPGYFFTFFLDVSLGLGIHQPGAGRMAPASIQTWPEVQKNLDNPIGLVLPKGLACHCCVAPGSTAVTKRYSRRIRPKLDRACVS